MKTRFNSILCNSFVIPIIILYSNIPPSQNLSCHIHSVAIRSGRSQYPHSVQERGRLTERGCSGVSTQTPLPSGHHPSSPGTNSAGNQPSSPLFPTFQTSRPPVHPFYHFSADISSPMNQLRVHLERENYESPALGEFGVSALPTVWSLLQNVYEWWVGSYPPGSHGGYRGLSGGYREVGSAILNPRSQKLVLGNLPCHLSVPTSRLSCIYLHL